MLFSAAVARLAGLAARVLGWRPQEFWAATPAELALSLGEPSPTDVPPSRAELMTLIAKDADHARSH